MILSSPLNKKWNTALLSFPPILLFNYTSNFGCTIIIPHQSNLVDQESFSNFLFLFWNYLSTTTPELFPLWRNPAISLFPISFHIKKGNKKNQTKIISIVYYASEAILKKSEKNQGFENFGFLIFERSKIPGFMGLCLFPALNNEDFVMCKNQIYCSFMRWEGGDLALFFAWHHGCHVVVFFPVKRVKRHWIW